jgi:hypothetical protein
MSAIDDFSDLIPIIGIILDDFKTISSSSILSSSSSSSSSLLSIGGGGGERRGGGEVSAEDDCDDDDSQDDQVCDCKVEVEVDVDVDVGTRISGCLHHQKRLSLSLSEVGFVTHRLARLHEWYEDADNVPLLKKLRQSVMDQVRLISKVIYMSDVFKAK